MQPAGDLRIVVLVLAAAALVLSAPVVGRVGFPGAADVLVVLAATSGTGAFALAAVQSAIGARAARRADPDKPSC